MNGTPPIEECLARREPPLVWLFEAAAAFEGEDPAGMYDDPGVLARSLETAADLFGLPAVSTSFDTTLEAEAVGCSVETGEDGTRRVTGCVETVDDAFDVDFDAVVAGGRVPTVLDATERLVASLSTTSVLGGITGPGRLSDHLLVADDPDPELLEETMFTAGEVLTEVANAYLDRDAAGLALLEPDGVEDTFDYRDAVSPVANVLDHYEGTGVVVQRTVTADEVELAAEVGFDAITGRPDDLDAAIDAAERHDVALGVGIPGDRFADGTAADYADDLPGTALVSSEWAVPEGTSADTLHAVMDSL